MMGKIFGTDGIRGRANKNYLLPENISKLGRAVAVHVKNKNKKKKKHFIVLSKDTRLSGYLIETALTSGILSANVNVFLVGPMPTAALSHLVTSLNCEAGIMITASHNPALENGIKIFNEKGLKLNENEEKKIEEIYFENDLKKINERSIGKAVRIDDAKGRYIEFVKNSAKNYSLRGMKIVLDCAHGSAYDVAPKVFNELRAQVNALNVKPSGLNINLNCGAIHPEKMAKKVKKDGDIGFAFDGDADRIVVADEKGQIVDGDKLIAFIATELLRQGMLKKKTIVSTVLINSAVKEFLGRKGIKILEVPVGDKFVANELHEKDLLFGGEPSGHIILRNSGKSADAIVTALFIAKTLNERQLKASKINDLLKLYPSRMISLKVKERKDLEKLNAWKTFKELKRKTGKKGKVIVRYSGTENLLRISVEHKDKNKMNKYLNRLVKEFEKELK